MTSVKKLNTSEDVLQQILVLQQSGYRREGNWSLGQTCNHLAAAIEMTVTGLFRFMPRIGQRIFVGLFLKLSFLGKYGAKLGLRVPTSLPQNKPIDDDVGVDRLRQSMKLLEQPKAAHLVPFHLWHCRHHLGFLRVNAESSAAGGPATLTSELDGVSA